MLPDRACWEQNLDVSKIEKLVEVLAGAGFDAEDLIKKASTQEIKDQLRRNTDEARELGLCGVPSYRVLEKDSGGSWKVCGGLVWGQDELAVVQDLIAGWRAENMKDIADVSREHKGKGEKTASKL